MPQGPGPLAAAMVGSPMLLARTGSIGCAIPVASVIETMRPLPVEPISGLPPFIRGVAIIRARPTPVVDLALVLQGREGVAPGRFITIRSGERAVALGVDAVLGLRRITAPTLLQLPPLLRRASDATVRFLATLDAALVAVLDTAKVVPDDAWPLLEGAAK